MKRFKLNLAMIAMLVAVTAAFAFKPAAKHFEDPLWTYQSGSTTAGSNYDPYEDEPCEGSTQICVVMAPEDPGNPGHPLLDDDLRIRISNLDTTDGDVFLKP